MHKQLDVVRKTRIAIINLISDLSTEEFNTVPKGFNNNIIWNLGHLVAAQDNICYGRAGLPLNIEQDYFDVYKAGSKPERQVSSDEITRIKDLLFSSLDKLEEDIPKEIFNNYSPWTTRYGVEIENLNDGLTLLAFHDGLHFGCMLALKKLVR